MDALTLLKDDHDKVKGMLAKLDKTTERAEVTRAEGLQALKQELTIHETIEEEILYPALKEFAKTRDIALEAYEEHHVVDSILAELEQTPVDDETWAAKLTVMKENLEHHIEEEEEEMFKQARQVMDEGDLSELGDRMAARKEELQTAPADEDQARQQPHARDRPSSTRARVLLRGSPKPSGHRPGHAGPDLVPRHPARVVGCLDLPLPRGAPAGGRDGCGGPASVPVSRGVACETGRPEVSAGRAFRGGASSAARGV